MGKAYFHDFQVLVVRIFFLLLLFSFPLNSVVIFSRKALRISTGHFKKTSHESHPLSKSQMKITTRLSNFFFQRKEAQSLFLQCEWQASTRDRAKSLAQGDVIFRPLKWKDKWAISGQPAAEHWRYQRTEHFQR